MILRLYLNENKAYSKFILLCSYCILYILCKFIIILQLHLKQEILCKIKN